MRRRRALTVIGGVFTGVLGGCMDAGVGFETYRYEQDAPLGGSEVSPWPTLGFGSRRRSYSPYGWLPARTDGAVFARAGQANPIQPALVDGMAYFGGRITQDGGDGSADSPSGIRGISGDQGGWAVQERDDIAAPTAAGNALFVSSNGMTRALDRGDGTLCWEYHEGLSYPTVSPTVVDDTVYVVGQRLLALAARTGEVQWTTEQLDLTPQGTAVTDDAVFVTATGDGEGMVYRFNAETGNPEWRTAIDSSIGVPPVLGEQLYVFAANGRLQAFEPTDGTAAWSHQFEGRSSSMPAVGRGLVFAAATNGDRLKALNAINGEVRWEFNFDGRRTPGPTVADDVVFLPMSTSDGGRIDTLLTQSDSVLASHTLPHQPASKLVIGEGRGLINIDPSQSGTLLYMLSGA